MLIPNSLHLAPLLPSWATHRFWMVYEFLQTVLQILALVLLFVYTCQNIPDARIQTT